MEKVLVIAADITHLRTYSKVCIFLGPVSITSNVPRTVVTLISFSAMSAGLNTVTDQAGRTFNKILVTSATHVFRDKITLVTSQPPGTVTTELDRYKRSIYVDHLYSTRQFFRGLTNWFSQRCLIKQFY